MRDSRAVCVKAVQKDYANFQYQINLSASYNYMNASIYLLNIVITTNVKPSRTVERKNYFLKPNYNRAL